MDEGIDDGNLKIYKGYVSIKESTETGPARPATVGPFQ